MSHKASPWTEFTPRQTAILELMAEGCTDRSISRSLGISDRQVRREVFIMIESTGSRGRIPLVLKASNHGLITVVLSGKGSLLNKLIGEPCFVFGLVR